MERVRNVLRLSELGFNQRAIARALQKGAWHQVILPGDPDDPLASEYADTLFRVLGKVPAHFF